MLLETARRYRNDFHPFRPYAPAADRKSWEWLPEKLKQDLIRNGEAFRNYPYALIPATKYMEFCRIGNRSMFEELYFTRRRVLNALVMAECVEDKGRFLDDIVNGLMAVCEESGWQLPAHNYHPGTGALPVADAARPLLDLFACETGAQVAMVSYLLHDRLEEISPLLNRRVQYEIRRRILTPYLTEHFEWMGEYGQKVNNWTPWCTQNVLIAAFSLKELGREDGRRVLEQAAKSLDIFLDTYGEDGCCNEGAGYYHAAGLCLFNAIEVIDAVTDDAFIGLYQVNKIRNIAPYIMNVHVDDRYYANFADCSPTAGRAGAREFLFAKRVGNGDMMRYAAKDHQADESHTLPRSENLFYRLQAAFTEAEITSFDCSKPVEKHDLYYESVGLLIARDSRFFLAAKAGGNDDSHNHNDTGSITVYRDGKPFLIDVGVETYSRKTFSPQRYDIWTMQSAYHNVLTFGTRMQKAGPEFGARDVKVSLTDAAASISMELSGCYPAGTVASYRRTIVFEKGKAIRVADTCSSLPDGTYLSLMSLGKPVWDENTLKLEGGGAIAFPGREKAGIEAIELTDPKLFSEWGHVIYRTRVYLRGPELDFIIKE